MLSRVLHYLLPLLLSATLCPGALAADQIIWGKHHVPPYMIREGPLAHQGIFDLTLDVLKENLPQYQHVELGAPFPRVISEIKRGAHWCYIGTLKTPEREGDGYFSLPTSIFLPLRIIVRRDRAAQFAGPQSLQRLLQNSQLVTSVMRNRSYSPTVDRLLTSYPPRESYSEQAEAISMLLAGRLDYMIELPLLAFDQARLMGRPDELVAIATLEADEVVFNRVMCPRNAWGKKVIEQVNTVLDANRDKPYYRSIVEKWHDPASVAEIRKIYDSVFLKTP
ncbi:transporter substrate-binding domain-containing protein [Herbaspirillum sp. YR522]|uniref:transporter substrate-binding domain-containing protein n=1 Tax=Herbaspirillum sp. YR522 TaxID=1144342 RepID=UPI00026FA25D|nr:transporter substrate-binding domain-containing protein [Herbaspirillum sp. YR522]EJN07858.1 periplasmic component of amino acid ABC-type transporter/signal transduction system [Herbaspirillum sp. YR522]